MPKKADWHEDACRLHAEGVSVDEIASRFARKPSTVRWVISTRRQLNEADPNEVAFLRALMAGD